MAENNPGSNQGGQKQGGLSWSSPASKPAAAAPMSFANAGKPPAPFTPPLPKAPPMQSAPMSKAAAPAQKSGMGRLVGIFAGGIIVGFLLGWGWSSTQSGTPTSTSNTTSNTQTAGSQNTQTQTEEGSAVSGSVGSGIGITGTGVVTSSSDALSVPMSQNAGMQVAVSNAIVSKPTWVLVYDSVNGKPSGKSLGGMIFFPDTKSATLDLLRATVPGHSYVVVMNVDDGDFVFSSTKDLPVHDAQGALVSVAFQTN